MKKFYVLLTFLLLGVGLNAQITCNTWFWAQQSTTNQTTFQFIDSTTSTNTSSPTHYYRLTYDFGDNSTTTRSRGLAQPVYPVSHQYSSVGIFPVELKVEVVDSLAFGAVVCTSFAYDTIVISQVVNCNADFQYAQTTSGSLNINFQNNSSNVSTTPVYETYNWNFGDGNSSTQENPSHVYSTSNFYTVTLTYQVRDSVTSAVLCTDMYARGVRPGSVDSCYAYFTSRPDNTNHLEINFNSYGGSGSATSQNTVTSYEWYFGDGNSSTSRNPTHVYSQLGTYQVTHIVYGRDSLTQAVFCSDTFAQAVVVNYPQPNCRASFFLDSTNSSATNVNIYNISTPIANSSAYAVNYLWDFGDGNTSNQTFPSHTFQSNGIYNVCVTVSVTDTNNQICSDTYCRQIGVDSLGNVIFKNSSTGFTLNVLDPNTVGQQEYELDPVSLYPNPASEFITIEGLKEKTSWSLISITGSKVAEGILNAGERTFSILDVPDGLYILNLEGAKNLKVQVKH